MNEVLELWSLPWHDLQRSLAKTFAAETTPHPDSPGVAGTIRAATTHSWLGKARNRASLTCK